MQVFNYRTLKKIFVLFFCIKTVSYWYCDQNYCKICNAQFSSDEFCFLSCRVVNMKKLIKVSRSNNSFNCVYYVPLLLLMQNMSMGKDKSPLFVTILVITWSVASMELGIGSYWIITLNQLRSGRPRQA